jgi:RimJ/RimL family protein N-acetyltransferase
MSHPIEVRVATPEDAWGIARARVRGWQAGYRGLIPQDYLDAMSIEANVERTRRWAWAAETSLHWVCLSEGEIVGWTCAFSRARGDDLDDATGEIVACYAVPEVWGLGMGHRMIEVATVTLTNAGCSSIVLWVLEANERAQRFYSRQGYAFDGGRKVEELTPGVELISVRMRRSI